MGVVFGVLASVVLGTSFRPDPRPLPLPRPRPRPGVDFGLSFAAGEGLTGVVDALPRPLPRGRPLPTELGVLIGVTGVLPAADVDTNFLLVSLK